MVSLDVYYGILGNLSRKLCICTRNRPDPYPPHLPARADDTRYLSDSRAG